MPNECLNTVRFDGSDLSAVRDYLGRGRFSFRDFVPLHECPICGTSNMCQSRHLEGDQCIMNWRVKHWGTKWDAQDVEATAPQQIGFWTAWTPPSDELMCAISSRFPGVTVTLEYEERGMNFAGTAIYADGVVLSHERRECSWDDDEDDQGVFRELNLPEIHW